MMYLIGTGGMSRAYAKILLRLSVPFKVIGRGAASASLFEQETGVKPLRGGIDQYLHDHRFSADDHIIISTGTEMLMPVLKAVIEAGGRNILTEKPASVSMRELLDNRSFLLPYAEHVFVGYNRRYYASVAKALEIIREDGGLKSMQFEFTEWSHKIEPLAKAPGVKENWFFANSTHVVDLAFFIGGKPKEWASYSAKGSLEWHENSIYAGSGITERGVLFSYAANWESAGRWGLDLMTDKRRIVLRPMEVVAVQERGSIEQHLVAADDAIDKEFKHGLYAQVKDFLDGNREKACSLAEHMENTRSVYLKMNQV